VRSVPNQVERLEQAKARFCPRVARLMAPGCDLLHTLIAEPRRYWVGAAAPRGGCRQKEAPPKRGQFSGSVVGKIHNYRCGSGRWQEYDAKPRFRTAACHAGREGRTMSETRIYVLDLTDSDRVRPIEALNS
jgi:hypothetical protein